jgi:hypothetical protein
VRDEVRDLVAGQRRAHTRDRRELTGDLLLRDVRRRLRDLRVGRRVGALGSSERGLRDGERLLGLGDGRGLLACVGLGVPQILLSLSRLLNQMLRVGLRLVRGVVGFVRGVLVRSRVGDLRDHRGMDRRDLRRHGRALSLAECRRPRRDDGVRVREIPLRVGQPLSRVGDGLLRLLHCVVRVVGGVAELTVGLRSEVCDLVGDVGHVLAPVALDDDVEVLLRIGGRCGGERGGDEDPGGRRRARRRRVR